MSNTYCVIMAGGIGSRFWPVSTSTFPKQFHDILGTGRTLLQQTFDRLLKITTAEKIMVVTHQLYKDLVHEQLPEMPVENILLEPARRNTAPCIAYAAYRIKSQDPDGVMMVCPSDHIITNQDEFCRVADVAIAEAMSSDVLLTMGIKPHRPDTGYGYIQFVNQDENPDSEIKKVKTFTEKPTLDLAKQFVDSGEFLWNAGIFVWSVKSFFPELAAYLPDMYNNFEPEADKFGTAQEAEMIENIYPSCENESIDFGIMEKSQKVYTIPSDFGWSDLGTWGSLHEHVPHDEDQNAVVGNRVNLQGGKDNMVFIPKNKVAVIEGLENYIIVDQPEALLIVPKDSEQLIKAYVNDVKLKWGEKYV